MHYVAFQTGILKQMSVMHVKPAGLPHVTFFFITGDVLEIAFTITVV